MSNWKTTVQNDLYQVCGDVHGAVCQFPDNAAVCDRLAQCQRVEIPVFLMSAPALAQAQNQTRTALRHPSNEVAMALPGALNIGSDGAENQCRRITIKTTGDIGKVLTCTVQMVSTQQHLLLQRMAIEKLCLVGAVIAATCAWFGMVCMDIRDTCKVLAEEQSDFDARYSNMDSSSNCSVGNTIKKYTLPLLLGVSMFVAGICVGLRWSGSADNWMMTHVGDWLQDQVVEDLHNLDQLAFQNSASSVMNVSAFGDLAYDLSTAVGMAARRSWVHSMDFDN